jgi:hypothetical protein
MRKEPRTRWRRICHGGRIEHNKSAVHIPTREFQPLTPKVCLKILGNRTVHVPSQGRSSPHQILFPTALDEAHIGKCVY